MAASPIPKPRRFAVALSFPGERREFLARVADSLAQKLGKARVLYDKYHEAEFARPNLDVHLPNLYRTESDLIAIFLCDEYKKKRWCKLEWRSVRQLISTADEDRIMFLSFDDVGAIPEIGILDGDGYVSIGKRSPEDIADLILQRLGPQLKEKEEPSPRANADLVVAPTRLHHGADHLFGRDEALAALDRLASDPTKKILTIVAFGGVGKTSLVIEWMARQAAKNWEGFERVFDWSFFSQGTREQGGASADTFIAAALKFFGDEAMAQSPASPWDKGECLAQLVTQRRSLLVLDGVEPLQHPPGPLAGELKDPALATLLKGLARSNSGLCIVTTRERVADLAPFRDTTAPEWQLHHLSVQAGVELLNTLGVRGTAAEFEQLVEKVKGHALTLNLLGRYLAKAHGGDMRKSDQVKFEKADAATQGGYAFKTIGAYERWLNEGGKDGARQLALLRLLGLFDRPADAGCMAALRREPAIADLTEPLVGLAEEDWNLAISALEECGLVSRSAIGEFETQNSKLETALDAHPLIREYFGKQLSEQHPEAWRSAHQRLYEYLRDSTLDKPQPTLEDLQPLYQAVAHGCKAGLAQEALQVYRARILRGTGTTGFYSKRVLGAFGLDVGAVACFFKHRWNSFLSGIVEKEQAWLLNEAATGLRALGRLVEAREPLQAGIKLCVEQEVWPLASSITVNLSELDLTLGEIALAIEDAEQSVGFAKRTPEDVWNSVSARIRLGDAYLAAGRRDEASDVFSKSATDLASSTPIPWLPGNWGFRQDEVRLVEVERRVWRSMLGIGADQDSFSILSVAESVVEDGKRRLRADINNKQYRLEIALDHLAAARATLYCTVLQKSDVVGIRSEVEESMDGLRRAGTQHWIPAALLSRCWLYFLEDNKENGEADLDEAWEIAERGPMKLFMADIHLYRARLFHSVKPYPWNKNTDGTERGPKDELAAARKLIEQCGYWRRKEELEDAEEAAKSW